MREATVSNNEYRNDKAGLIFLFSLLSIVFFADFIIEVSRTVYSSSSSNSFKAENTVLINELNNISGPLPVFTEHEMISLETNAGEFHSGRFRLSTLLFLLASFRFFIQFFRRIDRTGNIKTFTEIRYFSFLKSISALPRPPPFVPVI